MTSGHLPRIGCSLLLVGSTFTGIRSVANAQTPPLPDCFEVEVVASGFNEPPALAFANDERMFVADKAGIVWIVDKGVRLANPFIDLREKVGDAHDRGMLGLRRILITLQIPGSICYTWRTRPVTSDSVDLRSHWAAALDRNWVEGN